MTTTTRTQAPVVDTSRSPHAKLRPVPVSAVRLTGAFWATRRERNRAVTLPAQHRLLEETGRLDNLRRAAGQRPDLPFQGKYFNDSDVYKWIEAAAWALADGPDPALQTTMDDTIALVAAAQRPDGYLNSYFALDRAEERWTNLDLHELYCAGHLIQGAVAHHRVTGSAALLDVATRFADHIGETFGPAAEGKRESSDGHEEIELALVELFRTTGERRYLDLAQFFVDVRGHRNLGRPYGRWGPEYHQDHVPFAEMESLVGHAVRALYFACGAADLALETGDPALQTAGDRLWRDTVARKTYLGGGLGSRWEGEAFGEAYELPNERAYTETCAAIASVMWNWRLLLATAEARFADALEIALHNAVLAGIALDGETYFYQNPLADAGRHRRQPWFGTACCPPNIARLLASLPGYAYAVSDAAVWVHLYAEGDADLALPGGAAVRLRQQTDYPWDGTVTITLDEVSGDSEFSLMLRVPAWCETGAALTVNGEPHPAPLRPGAYAETRRAWRPGDTITLTLPMPVRRVESHPAVLDNVGRLALLRGPLVYAVEATDLGGADPRTVVLPPDAPIEAAYRPDLLDGVVALTGDAFAPPPDPTWDGALTRTADPASHQPTAIPLTAIPYFAWANRDPGPMAVWLRTAL